MSHSPQNIEAIFNPQQHTFRIGDIQVSDFLNFLKIQSGLTIYQPFVYKETDSPFCFDENDFDILFLGTQYIEIDVSNCPNIWNHIYQDCRYSDGQNWLFELNVEKDLGSVFVYKDYSNVMIQANDNSALKNLVLDLLDAMHFPADFIWEMVEKYENHSIDIDFLRYQDMYYAENTSTSLRNKIAKNIWENEQFTKENYACAAIHDLYFPSNYLSPDFSQYLNKIGFFYGDIFTEWVELNGNLTILLFFDEELNPLNPVGDFMFRAGDFDQESINFVKKMMKMRVSFEGQIFSLKQQLESCQFQQAFGVIWTKRDEELSVRDKCDKLMSYMLQLFELSQSTHEHMILIDGLGNLKFPASEELIQLFSSQLLTDITEKERGCVVRIGLSDVNQVENLTTCCKLFFEQQFNRYKSEIDRLFLD